MFFFQFFCFFCFCFLQHDHKQKWIDHFLQSLERLALYVSTLHVSALRYTGRCGALRYTMVARQRLALYTTLLVSALR